VRLKDGRPRPDASTVSNSGAASTRRRRGEPKTYDFRRPVRLAREHAHLLRVAMQTFARQSTTVLTTSLRVVCQVGTPRIEELSYDEFLNSLPEQSVTCVITLEPWQGKALLSFDLTTLLTMIDHQLGGTGSDTQPDRPLTDIEQSLIRLLVPRLLRELSYALESIAKGVQPQLLTLEGDARFVQAAASTDPVVVAHMDLMVGTKESVLSLCLPYSMLAPVLEAVTRSGDSHEKTQARADAAQRTQRRLSDVEVDVAVRFEPQRMSSQTIGLLTVGDVIALGHRTTAPMSVVSASTVFARAVPGSAGRTLAVLIVPNR
jgi:flagellar motor switch protein FliM